MKLIAILTLLTGFAVNATAQDCYALQNGDTLRIGNSRIERALLLGEGGVRTLWLKDVAAGRILNTAGQQADFYLSDAPATSLRWESFSVEDYPCFPRRFAVRISFVQDRTEVRREYILSDGVPAIACETYLKGSVAELPAGGIVLDRLSFAGRHWHSRAVRFFDVTDDNNNLVKEDVFVSYRRSSSHSGNLLFARDALSGNGFFFLKEAPCSNVQLASAGIDFTTEYGCFQTVGAGVEPLDITAQEWTRLYGCVTGVTGETELDALSAVRTWQKTVRKAEDMVMMNTWGDRSQDGRISETFCLQELEKAARLGVTVFQIDDGWQTGKSPNSVSGGSFHDIWRDSLYWAPDPVKFPRGLEPVVEKGKELGIQIGLWFNPSTSGEFKDWERDAAAMIGLYRMYGIRIFKIDGVAIPTKRAEIRLRKMLESVYDATDGQVFFNLDVTAGRRAGYHYFGEYGNLFLENRYTDWGNYYPCYTLRNLWQLSRYVPAEKLQAEFLNPWRNASEYPEGDPYAPSNYSFDYLAAITFAGQPLAWMEASNLPEEAFATGRLLQTYKEHSSAFHRGIILPIGEEPSGGSWTGFQSIVTDKTGYLLVYREDSPCKKAEIKTWLPAGGKVRLTPVAGQGRKYRIKRNGDLSIRMNDRNSFVLFKYDICK